MSVQGKKEGAYMFNFGGVRNCLLQISKLKFGILKSSPLAPILNNYDIFLRNI